VLPAAVNYENFEIERFMNVKLFCIYLSCVSEMTSVPWKGLMFDFMSKYNTLSQL
jgi:hypothetical protein